MSYWVPSKDEKEDEERRKQEEIIRQAVLRQYLSPEARQRLKNVSLVKPELAKRVEAIIIQLAMEGRLNRVITDEELKEILIKMQKKKDFRIRGFGYG
jgi:programmed cell death protein 5